MDEVHYLADRFRGAVWEEVIIGLAESIQVVALSATVSNAEEFGEWLSEVRGEMAVVVSERRPVPLFQHVLVGHTLYDLFADVAPTARAEPGGRSEVNPALVKVAREESRYVRDDSRRPRGPRRPRASGRSATAAARTAERRTARAYEGSGHRPRSLSAPSRPEMVELLDAEALLPAIVFIFSRVGCDAAVRQLLASGVRLTSPGEQREIAAILARHVGRAVRRRPARARLRPVRRGAGPRRRRPPRRHAARVQGVRRGGVRPGPDQGGLRHRDPGPRASTCRPESWCWRSWSSTTARPTPTSRRGSTPSSPAGPAAGASTSRATPSCCGSRGWIPGRSPGWPRGVPIRSGPRSRRPTTWRSTWSAASAGTGPVPCWSSRSPSSSPTARSSAWRAALARNTEAIDGYWRGRGLRPR